MLKTTIHQHIKERKHKTSKLLYVFWYYKHFCNVKKKLSNYPLTVSTFCLLQCNFIKYLFSYAVPFRQEKSTLYWQISFMQV